MGWKLTLDERGQAVKVEVADCSYSLVRKDRVVDSERSNTTTLLKLMARKGIFTADELVRELYGVTDNPALVDARRGAAMKLIQRVRGMLQRNLPGIWLISRKDTFLARAVADTDGSITVTAYWRNHAEQSPA